MAKEYSGGSLHKHASGGGLVWRGIIRYKDGEKWRSVSKLLTDTDGETIKAYPDKPGGAADNRGRSIAEKALRRWRESLIEADRATEAREVGLYGATVAEYVDRYIDAREAMGSIEQSTVLDYRHTAKTIRAEFADTPLEGLTRDMVEAFEVKLLEGKPLACDAPDKRRKPLGASTVGKSHRLLKMVMAHAADVAEAIPKNPVAGVKPPKRPKAEKNALDTESRARFADYIETHEPTPTVTGAALALFAGLGTAEACALKWRDVDLERRAIAVNEAIGVAKGGAYKKTPKVPTRNRRIDIPAQLAAVLERRRALYVETCIEAGVPLTGDMYVLGYPDGRFMSPEVLARGWRRVAEDEGYRGTKSRKVGFYDLRHTFATVAIAAGVDVETVASMMGHASTQQTLDTYGDATPESKRRAALAIEQAYTKVVPLPRAATGTDGA